MTTRSLGDGMRMAWYGWMCLASLCLLSGCNVIGVAATVMTPPKKVDAKYELPDKATLIVVDDPHGMVNSPATLRRIASATRNVLEVEKVVVGGGFVGQAELAGYREELGERYNQASLAALAMHLGAKQVVHAEVTEFQVDLGGNVIRPAIALDIKVFDLDRRARVFPSRHNIDSSADIGASVYSLQSQMPTQDITGQSATRSIAVRELADQTGRDMARLFFDWRMPEPGSGLGKPQ